MDNKSGKGLDLTIQVLHKVREYIPNIVNGYAAFKDDEVGAAGMLESIGAPQTVTYMNMSSQETHYYDVSLINTDIKAMEYQLSQLGNAFQKLQPDEIMSENGSFKFIKGDVSVTPHASRLVDDNGTYEFQMTLSVRILKLS